MKLYGTHAHLADQEREPRAKVFFCVVIGLPPRLADAAQRNRMRDEMSRITNRIGPLISRRQRTGQSSKVETIESMEC